MSVPFPQIRKDPMNAGSSERGGCGSEIERLCELQGSDHTTTTTPPPHHHCTDPLELFVHALEKVHTVAHWKCSLFTHWKYHTLPAVGGELIDPKLPKTKKMYCYQTFLGAVLCIKARENFEFGEK